MRILVTGGAGFIGSNVTDRLVAAGHEIVVVDNLSSGRRENLNPKAKFVHADIAAPEALAAVAAFKPEAIAHYAAQIDVRKSVADPGFDADVNIVRPLRLLEAARTAGLKFVLFASTGGAIYGEPQIIPAPETHPTKPESPYGASKAAFETYLVMYNKLYGLKYAAMRFANVYGPRQDPHGEAGVVAIFAKRMLKGEPVTIFGDGGQTRDYVFVGDVAAACVAAIDRVPAGKADPGPYNVGTGVETDVNELARRMAKIVGYTRGPDHAPARPGEQRRSVIDGALAKRVLGFSPRVSLDDGLRQTIDWFRQ